MENQKRATSSINLAALGKSQSVRFLDEMPEHRNCANKGKARAEEVSPDKTGPLGRSERSPPPATSSAIEEEADEEDDDDAETPALPRTKSQLSMLIDKERKYSGSANLVSEPSRQEDRHGKGDQGKEDEEEENELLIMGRRDKKGKPKDPDQPFRAAAKKGLWKGGRGDDDLTGGLGSPPPVF